jgi:hypothetical protein
MMEDNLKSTFNILRKAALVAIFPCVGMGLLLFIVIDKHLKDIKTWQLIGLILAEIIIIPLLINLLIPVAKNLRWAIIITIPTLCVLLLFILIKSYSVSFDAQTKLTDPWYFIAMNCFEGPIVALLILVPFSLAGWFGALLNRKMAMK